jgi:hypothetical protein
MKRQFAIITLVLELTRNKVNLYQADSAFTVQYGNRYTAR